MNVLLDTCVLSEMVKPSPRQAVLGWLEGQREEHLYLSALTFGEIQKGIAKLSDGRRRRALQAWVDGDLRDRFFGRILDVDHVVASRWGLLLGSAERRGTRLQVIDSLIAATAITHGLVVATRNIEDMVRCGAEAVNPWEG